MKIISSVATHQGRREYQEDRYKYNETEDGILMAVFDGHGGDDTSEFCEDNILTAFNVVADDPKYPEIADKIRGIFNHLNTATNRNETGSTASIVFIPATLNRAFVGVLGDSPVIIKTDYGIISHSVSHVVTETGDKEYHIVKGVLSSKGDYWHSPEHNVRSNPAEVARIKASGGIVYGGYAYTDSPMSDLSRGGLQLSRTLGDKDFSRILNREPEIFEVPLGPGSFVLVGTDGLFDPSHESSRAASDIIALVEKSATAGNLVHQASIAKPTGDNVTALLLRVIE